MDFVGGIDGMKFTPISNYNNYLKSNTAFDVESGMDFENILSQQTASLQNPVQMQGGIELNNFDDVIGKNSVQSVSSAGSSPSSSSGSTGDLMKSFSNSIGGGLNSVNDSVDNANKAQEALAMGEDISVHDVMIASEKASLSLSMAMQLRNKLLSAYTEINNVRV